MLGAYLKCKDINPLFKGKRNPEWGWGKSYLRLKTKITPDQDAILTFWWKNVLRDFYDNWKLIISLFVDKNHDIQHLIWSPAMWLSSFWGKLLLFVARGSNSNFHPSNNTLLFLSFFWRLYPIQLDNLRARTEYLGNIQQAIKQVSLIAKPMFEFCTISTCSSYELNFQVLLKIKFVYILPTIYQIWAS